MVGLLEILSLRLSWADGRFLTGPGLENMGGPPCGCREPRCLAGGCRWRAGKAYWLLEIVLVHGAPASLLLSWAQNHLFQARATTAHPSQGFSAAGLLDPVQRTFLQIVWSVLGTKQRQQVFPGETLHVIPMKPEASHHRCGPPPRGSSRDPGLARSRQSPSASMAEGSVQPPGLQWAPRSSRSARSFAHPRLSPRRGSREAFLKCLLKYLFPFG